MHRVAAILQLVADAPSSLAFFNVAACNVPAGNVEEGVVSLYSGEVGMWQYNMSGVGVKPGLMEPIHIAAALGGDGSSFVSWRNPFVDAVKVSLNACCGW